MSSFGEDDFQGQNINFEDNNEDRFGGNKNSDPNHKKNEINDKGRTYQTKNATVTERISGIAESKIDEFIKSLGKYFDIDLSDLLNRLKGALIPFNKSFSQSAIDNPDIYGPFWVFTTIIFLIAACANFSGYLNTKNGEKFYYNLNFLPYAALFIYGIGFGVPSAIFLIGRFAFHIEYSYIQNLCLYGYSFVIMIPILMLCMIPSDLLELLLLIYYTVHSSCFLLFNMYKFLETNETKQKYIILGILGGCQVALFFALKFYFFKNANVQIKIQ